MTRAVALHELGAALYPEDTQYVSPRRAHEWAGDVLAAGTEAMMEAAFRTGEYADAEAMLQTALARARTDGDRAVESAALDRLGWLMHFQALDRGLNRIGMPRCRTTGSLGTR